VCDEVPDDDDDDIHDADSDLVMGSLVCWGELRCCLCFWVRHWVGHGLSSYDAGVGMVDCGIEVALVEYVSSS
jgi:hypothetical protein